MSLIGSALKRINAKRPGHRTLAQYLEESAVLRAVRDTERVQHVSRLERAINQAVAYLRMASARRDEESGMSPGECGELDGARELCTSVADNLVASWVMAHDQIPAPVAPAASAAA